MKLHLRRSLILCLLLPLASAAQQSELIEKLQAVQEELSARVETSRYGYDQELNYEPDAPHLVTITVVTTNLKNDKSESVTYETNLSDLHASRIHYQTDRDDQQIVLRTKNGQELIRSEDNDGDVDYTDEIELWSHEIDNAKAVRDLLREAVPLAEAVYSSVFEAENTLTGLASWFSENLTAVAQDDETIAVNWQSVDPGMPELVRLTITPLDDEDDAMSYLFNLADIDPRRSDLEVGNGEVAMKLQTSSRAKLIREEDSEGHIEDYTREVELPVPDIETGRRIRLSLEAAHPLAREARAGRMSEPGSMDEAVRMLGELIAEADYGDIRVQSTLETSPLVDMTQTITEVEDGEEEEVRLLFDFADLDAAEPELQVSKTRLSVVVPTQGDNDYVQRWEDGEADGFEDEVAFPVQDVEAARRVEELLPYLIERARERPEDTGDLAWLQEAVGTGSTDEEITQRFERQDADDCKLAFTRTTEGKNTEEERYEFNVYDLNARDIEFRTKGDVIELEVATRRNEEVINVYEDDEPSFTDELTVALASIADAKKARRTLVSLIEGCREEGR